MGASGWWLPWFPLAIPREADRGRRLTKASSTLAKEGQNSRLARPS